MKGGRGRNASERGRKKGWRGENTGERGRRKRRVVKILTREVERMC